MAVGGFSVLVHGETGFADGIAGRKPGGIFGIPLVERNDSVTAIKILHRVVDVLFVISYIGFAEKDHIYSN